jgi:hypothetical protein
MRVVENLKGAGPWIGFLFVALVLLALIAVGWEQWRITLPLFVTGFLIGWIVGMLMSPLSPHETEEFSEYGKAISTFIAGFLVAKLDKLFELYVGQPGTTGVALIMPVGFFIDGSLLGVLFTYVWRTYVSPPAKPDERNWWALVADNLRKLNDAGKLKSAEQRYAQQVVLQSLHTLNAEADIHASDNPQESQTIGGLV